MHVLDQRTLGIAVVLLLGAMIAVKLFATRSILDRPEGSGLVRLVNVYNLVFLLVVQPLVAGLLISRRLEVIDAARIGLPPGAVLTAVEIIGLLMYVAGFVLMAWALMRLGVNYQLGGTVPRPGGSLIVDGPYRWVRHPMYTAALAISLGLAWVVQSGVLVVLFGVYLVLILALLPLEEEGLRQAYGERYVAYAQEVSRLLPGVY